VTCSEYTLGIFCVPSCSEYFSAENGCNNTLAVAGNCDFPVSLNNTCVVAETDVNVGTVN